MSRDFEQVAGTSANLSPKTEGVESSVFDYMRTMVGDQQLSDFQAQQLRDAIDASYVTHTVEGEDPEDLAINLRDEVQQQMKLLRALRKELFFASGAPRPDTEGSDIKGYLNSSIQLMNLLQKFDDALKTDKDVQVIESALDQGFEMLSDHPDSTVAKDFVDVVAKALVGTEFGDRWKEEE